MRYLLLSIILLSIFFTVSAQSCSGPGYSPGAAHSVCGNLTFHQDQVTTCTGKGNLPNSSSGCGDIVTTDNAIWYKFHCYQSGKMGFILVPKSNGDDFDWEVLDVTGHPLSDVYREELRVSLNLSGQTGKTGCTTGGTLDVNCAGGNAGTQFNQLIDLIAGHDYLMMVNNWSSSGQGYTIDFSGTAVLTDNVLPTITNVSVLGCDASKIKVTFSEDIVCSSFSPAIGSEFAVTNGTHVINGIISDCSIGARAVPSIMIDLQTALTPGTYNLLVDKGSDADILMNVCFREMLATSIPFTVDPIPPMEINAVNFSGCAPNYLDITFSKPFVCSSIIATGTEFSITPGNPPVKSIEYYCVNGRISDLRINLYNPLPYGSYQLNVGLGADGNTITDTCGIDMPVGYNVPFVIRQTGVAPVIRSIGFDECHPDKVVLDFDKPVGCASLANDGSDFSITPGIWPIASMATDCGTNAYATQIILTLQNTLPAGNFSVNVNTGTDGTTISDTCFSFMTGPYSKAFVTTQAPVPIFDSLQFDKCTPSQIKIFYNKPISCGTVLPTGDQWYITGPSTVSIVSASGDATCVVTPTNPISYSNWYVLQLSAPITDEGTYVLHNQTAGTLTIADTCSATQDPSETISFNVLGTPSAAFTNQVIWACEMDTIIFSHPGGNGINSWQWEFSDGTTASGQTVRHAFPITTLTVNAKLTVSNGYCSATKDQDITLGNTFSPAFSQLPKDTVCINTPVVFTDGSIGSNLQYLWEFGDLTQYNGPTPPPHSYGVPGNYNIKLILTDSHGCIDTADRNMVVTSLGTVDFIGLRSQYCTGNQVFLTKLTGPNIYTYVWDNGDGKTFVDHRDAQFSYSTEKIYTITLTGNDKYCGPASISKTVQVYAIPKVDLGRDTVLCPDVRIPIGVADTSGYIYNWNTGAIGSQIVTDLVTKKYILVADNHGCKATDSIAIKLLPACLIKVPNAFTPNADGKNDKLKAENADLTRSFSLKVYNRFGQLLFISNDPIQGWDGTFKGNKVETGTYVWELNYIDPWTYKPVSERGTSLLIR